MVREQVVVSLIAVAAVGAAPSEGDVAAVETALLEQARTNIERHRKGDVEVRVVTPAGAPVANAGVLLEQVGHEFLFGCIVFPMVWSPDPYKQDLFKARFKELFNLAVFPFYWKRYERKEGAVGGGQMAEVLSWCRANGITTKGHPLVWAHQAGVPAWLSAYPPERRNELVLGRVTREVKRHAGRIDMWDVVNEPVNCRGWTRLGWQDYAEGGAASINSYVEKALKTAHEANPTAYLMVNEYSLVSRKQVRERFYRFVSDLKRRGTPISGLGLQAHEPREQWFPPKEVWATFERLAGLGYPLHVTEFIPQSSGKAIAGGWRGGRWTEKAQADFAEQFFRLSFGHPAVASINWWGLSDRRIWLQGGGLLTKEYEPKPVYRRLSKLIHEEWKTRTEASTDAGGTARLRGFYGTYRVTVKVSGRTRVFERSLRKGRENMWTITAP